MTKFSILTSLDSAEPVTKVIDLAKACEALDFDTLWLWDTWYTKDAYIGLTLAALHTEKLRLAPGVAATPVRHDAMLVNTIATLDDISNGRAVLGVGSGGQATVGRLGMRKARMKEFRESMRVMSTLLDGGEIDEHPALFNVDSVRRRIPIYTAAWGPRMLEASGELADGVIIMGPDNKEVLADKMAQIRAGAAAVGRAPEDVKIVFGITCAYADDPQPLIEKYKSLAVHHMQRVGYEGEYPEKFRPLFQNVRDGVSTIVFPEGEAPRHDLVPDEFVKYSLVIGTEEECLERLRDLLTLKPDELVFSMGFVDVEQVHKLAALVAKL